MDEWVRRVLCSIPYGQVGFNIIACRDGHGKRRLISPFHSFGTRIFQTVHGVCLLHKCIGATFKLRARTVLDGEGISTREVSSFQRVLKFMQELFLMGKASVLERCLHFRGFELEHIALANMCTIGALKIGAFFVGNSFDR